MTNEKITVSLHHISHFKGLLNRAMSIAEECKAAVELRVLTVPRFNYIRKREINQLLSKFPNVSFKLDFLPSLEEREGIYCKW